jgi:predicted metal-dependent phosphoesterase TrpH
MTARPMGKADLHIHTNHGDGLDSVDAIFQHVEAATDLDVIAITEHDCLEVALEARETWARRGYRFDFVPGVEVTTMEGHVIALYLEEPVPSLRRVEETIEAVRRQGGVCFVPHPMSWLTRSIGPRAFDRVDAAGLSFDGLELHSANPTTRFYMNKARRLNDARSRLPALGSSDAHFVEAIGSAYTTFEGTSALHMRRAIEDRSAGGAQTRFPSLRRIGLKRALGVPLAGLAATPRRLGWRRTAWSFMSRYWA